MILEKPFKKDSVIYDHQEELIWRAEISESESL